MDEVQVQWTLDIMLILLFLNRISIINLRESPKDIIWIILNFLLRQKNQYLIFFSWETIFGSFIIFLVNRKLKHVAVERIKICTSCERRKLFLNSIKIDWTCFKIGQIKDVFTSWFSTEKQIFILENTLKILKLI